MGRKKQTTLNLDIELIKKAKLLGLNMSQIMNETLMYVINTGTFQPLRVEVFLAEVKRGHLVELVASHKIDIKLIDSELIVLDDKIKKLNALLVEADRDTEIAGLFQQLHDLCKVVQYDLGDAWETSISIRDKLTKLGIEMNERSEFESYLTSVKS